MAGLTQHHEHQYTQRVKRKVQLSHYGATVQNPRPHGSTVGYDYLLCWKCKCGAVQPYDLVRELA